MSHAMHRLPARPAAIALSSRFKLPSRPPQPHETAFALTAARAAGTADECRLEAFIAATRHYEDGKWDFAFERLATLADHGHAPAAKLALLMLRYGRTLYGTHFDATPEQVAQWAQRVLRATSRPTASPSSITARA